MLQDGNREWITLLACICADGTKLTPSLIYQVASGNIQDTWLQDFDPSLHQCFFTSSSSGWTSNDIGLAWLEQVFNRETKAKARWQWRLLILDGYGSHVTMKFIEVCDRNKIILMMFPPHSTHTLQPLDVVMFSPLAAAYSKALADWMDKCQGLSSITKRDFFCLFWVAWEVSFEEKSILKALKCTGLAPFNPSQILTRFKLKELSRPSTSITTSVLSASDWRKIERLLHEVVEDVYDRQAAKLSQTIHTIAAQNTLYRHENKRLQEAFMNEKKRRQRGKPLLLETLPEKTSGAMWWSPKKVQDARLKQETKDLELQAQIHQKAEDARRKEEAKQLKQQFTNDRTLGRRSAKVSRDKDKAAEKEAAAIDRELSQQLKIALQLFKKGKRLSIKPIQPLKKPAVVVVNTPEPEKVDVGGAAAATTTTRRSRNTKKPSRYL
jgi:hypothetical protein